MKIKELISPVDGIFSYIPSDIWGDIYTPEDLDIEFFTRYGNKSASPLLNYFVKDGVVDYTGLANLIYRKYYRDWFRIHQALFEDYNTYLSARLDETQEITRTETNTGTDKHVIDNTGTQTQTKALQDLYKKSGKEINTGTSTDTFNKTNTNTLNLSDSSVTGGKDVLSMQHDTEVKITDSGSDVVNTEFGTTITDTGMLTKSGSEKNTTTNDNDISNTNVQDLTRTDALKTTQNTNTSNSGTDNIFGFDSTQAAPMTSNNGTSVNSNITDNTGTQKNAGTVTDSTIESGTSTNVLGFDERKDTSTNTNVKDGSDKTTQTFGKTTLTENSGTDINETIYGKTDTSLKTGTDTLAETGTVTNATNDTLTFENYQETTDTTGTDTRADALKEIKDGETSNSSDFHEKLVISRVADSPLNTSQDLLLAEITARMNNFVDIIMNAVQSQLTLKIWED